MIFDEWCFKEFKELVLADELMLDGSPSLRAAFAAWVYVRRYIYPTANFSGVCAFLMCCRHVYEGIGFPCLIVLYYISITLPTSTTLIIYSYLHTASHHPLDTIDTFIMSNFESTYLSNEQVPEARLRPFRLVPRSLKRSWTT